MRAGKNGCAGVLANPVRTSLGSQKWRESRGREDGESHVEGISRQNDLGAFTGHVAVLSHEFTTSHILGQVHSLRRTIIRLDKGWLS